jgi:hypothetical protein
MQPVRQEPSPRAVHRNQHRNVLPGEDAALYDRLRAELNARFAPETILEELEVEHLLNTLWEIQRLVRIKPQVVNIDRKRALADLLQHTLFNHRISRAQDVEEAGDLASAYFGSDDEREEVEQLLARFGLNADAVIAKAFVLNAATLEGIEGQIQLATARAYTIQAQLEMMIARRAQAPAKTLRLDDKRSGKPK